MTALFTADEITWEANPALLPCFLCGTLLTFPAIHWYGATGDVYLDERCFPDLFARMAVDAHVIRRARRTRSAS